VNWRVEPLTSGHDCGSFHSGNPPLDDYLRKYAGQYGRKNMGRTFVAVTPGDKRVLGYYTLAASSVSFEQAPDELIKKLPRYPLPTALLGKLAVDESVQGQGLGAFLLVDALRRVVDISGQMAVVAVEVHAIDARAGAFYARYGFQAFRDQPSHLFLPLATIQKLF
jgi:GNAT superfamily N-acetyltransferase